MGRSLNYGWAGLNNSFNPQLTGTNKNNLGNISSARVISIVLDDTHPRFKELGDWNALGAIEFDSADFPNYNSQNYPIAYPLFSNIKNFPLIQEIVIILSAFSSNVEDFEENSPILAAKYKNYYVVPINVWNHPHHNGYSFNIRETSPSQNKNYNQIEAGSVNIPSDKPITINLGKTFKEKSNIHPLLPFEGDIMYEGRWGNSIRFGSTITTGDSLIPNSWSTPNVGSNGDPIIIIRNGQGSSLIDPKTGNDITDQGYIPIIEDIKTDLSSIYLTSTQQIPINISREDYTSYKDSSFTPPVSPNQYSGAQIILDSGRLVFNTWEDHILLSSVKSINLNSKESVNIDTRKFIVRADNIYLGPQSLAKQPLMLGNKTVDLLKNLVDSLISLTDELKQLTSDPVAPNTPATFTNLNIKAIGTSTILKQIKQNLDTPNYLTSERNYTL